MLQFGAVSVAAALAAVIAFRNQFHRVFRFNRTAERTIFYVISLQILFSLITI